MATNSYSNLKSSSATWNKALRKFGVVTVMNAKVYNPINGLTKTEYTALEAVKDTEGYLTTVYESVFGSDTNAPTSIDFATLKVNEIMTLYLALKPIAELKYLKTANATQEGPTKTITGGQNASPLVKYGKTSRLEITNALGNAEALEALSGYTVEYFRSQIDSDYEVGATDVLHATNLFATNKTIIGDTFLLDANNNTEAPAYVIYYDFLPDSLISLTQDAEGDATVFDMNGDLIRTNILVGFKKENGTSGGTDGIVVGDFYTILPKIEWKGTTGDASYMDIVDHGITRQ